MSTKPEWDAADTNADAILHAELNATTHPDSHANSTGASTVHAGLAQALDLLACPACLAPLCSAAVSLSCSACGRIYPVEDGIPILLVDRATQPQTVPSSSCDPPL